MTNAITRRIGRYLAPSAIAAGIIGGAALGLAGTAGAATVADTPELRSGIQSGIVATPYIKAQPAPNVVPGPWWNTNNPGIYLQSGSTHLLAPNI